MKHAISRFSKSYFMHAVVGALLALPVFFVSVAIVAVARGSSVVFWITALALPLLIALLLYRMRAWSMDEETSVSGYAAYAIPGSTASLISLTLATMLAPWVGSQSIAVATVLSGVSVGLCSLFLDQTLSKLRQLGRPAKH